MGAGIWPTSLTWIQFVQSEEFQRRHSGHCAGKVLDLGSGHGLCGLVCAVQLQWGTVVMTDKVFLS